MVYMISLITLLAVWAIFTFSCLAIAIHGYLKDKRGYGGWGATAVFLFIMGALAISATLAK